MNYRIRDIIYTAFFVFMIISIFTQVMGQPALLYVDSSSMSPTIEKGDGFVAVPYMVSDDVSEDDIIVFESLELDGGGTTTHRVVGESDNGFITKGDNNPFTDQDADEPPVTETRIKSVVLQINDDPVTIPNLGLVVNIGSNIFGSISGFIGLDSLSITNTVSIIFGVLLLIYGVFPSSSKRNKNRDNTSKSRNALLIIIVFVLVALVPMNYTMLMSSGTYQYEIISSEQPNENPMIIEKGEKSDVTYSVKNTGLVPTIIYINEINENIEYKNDYIYIPPRSGKNVTIETKAPDETGNYYMSIKENRYICILPPFMITYLHNIHPILVFGLINSVVGSLCVLLCLVTVGSGKLRLRSKNRVKKTISEYVSRYDPDE